MTYAGRSAMVTPTEYQLLREEAGDLRRQLPTVSRTPSRRGGGMALHTADFEFQFWTRTFGFTLRMRKELVMLAVLLVVMALTPSDRAGQLPPTSSRACVASCHGG